MSQHSLIPTLVDVCHRLYARGLVTATDGNVTARLENGNVLTSRSGVNKGMITHHDFVEVTIEGRKVGGKGDASSEIAMHLFVYKHRPDVRAVVHAHPTHATAFATARIPLDKCVFPEVIVGMGKIPLADYATPSTYEVGESLAPYVKDHSAILLANHGAVAYGDDPLQAYFRMEKLEHAAHIAFLATMLGGPQSLTEQELERLRGVSAASYGKAIPAGDICRTGDEEIADKDLRAYVMNALRERGIE